MSLIIKLTQLEDSTLMLTSVTLSKMHLFLPSIMRQSYLSQNLRMT